MPGVLEVEPDPERPAPGRARAPPGFVADPAQRWRHRLSLSRRSLPGNLPRMDATRLARLMACLALALLATGFLHEDAGATQTVRPPVSVFHPGERPIGTVVTLHGGGWFSASDFGGTADGMMRPWIEMLTAAGVRVVNVDYRSGAESLPDTERSIRWANRRWPNDRTCVLGFSAGGHLALAADLRGSDMACAISVSGPMNLTDSTPQLEALAEAFFGDQVRALSPELHPTRIDAPSLLVAARCDRAIPFSKQRRAAKTLGTLFVAVRPGVGGRELHCSTDEVSYERAMARQLAFALRHLAETGEEP